MTRQEIIDIWQGWLAGHGIPSFPLFGIMNGKCRCKDGDLCRQPGKHPKIKGWRTLEGPYPVGPMDNLGVSTDQLVVVDFDAGYDVPDDFPETFRVSTGRGTHLWYWANPEHPIRNRTGWRPKIDIRAIGGLVAAPPSRHASGAEYTYVSGEIQPVPEFILTEQPIHTTRERAEAVTHVPTTTAEYIWPTIESLAAEAAAAPEGERNHTLFRVMCRYFDLARSGWAGEDALRVLFEAGLACGLDRGEVARTIESASRA